jgi:uncharacterized membrane protein
MNQFSWALAGFVAIHVGLAATGLRARAVAAIGEGPYRAFFSLASIALLAWLVVGYRAMRADPFDGLNAGIWTPAPWLVSLGAGIAFAGVVLAIAGLLSPGPTLVGYSARALAQPEPARGLLRVTRHPFLWGVAIWALGHVLANGERFALMLFGALGLMVLLGVRSIDRKMSAKGGEAWERFAQATSNAPFVAIAQGRNRFALGEIWWRLAAGVAVACVIAWTHQVAFGAPALAALSGR